MAWTYIRMVPDLLDDGLVEVAGVALECTNLEGVLHAREGDEVVSGLAALSELKALLLAARMDVKDPVVVGRG